MNSQSVTVELTQDSSDLPGKFHMNQKKNVFLYLTWAILVLSVMILPTTSYASDGDDLIIAATKGNLSTVRALLEKKVNVNYQDEDGTTALIKASRKGHVKVVQILLAKGAMVNHQDKDGGTALIKASRKGHVKVVQDLLAEGAKRLITRMKMAPQP